jgi:ribosomal-protein-alanine N-acetyltransferase
MVFLRSPFVIDVPPRLMFGKVVLRVPEISDFAAWADLRMGSRSFLQPWEPTWPHDDLTRSAFRARIKRYWRDIEDDSAYPFLVFDKSARTLVGGITLTNVRRGIAQTASVGYWIGEPFARQGFMTDAMAALMPFVFQQLRLHRLEAACLPHNLASIALLTRCGFRQEGLARKYLKIDGRWSDHLLFAALAEDRI